MKYPALSIAIIAGLAMACILPAQEPVSAMDRAKRVMAIRAAAKRVIEDSNAFLDAPQTRATMKARMEAFMKADIPANTNKDASRNLCIGYARLSIQDLLVSNVVLAVADASQHSPLPITVADVLANVDANWTGSVSKVSGSFTERHFDRVFAEARENVTTSQRIDVEKKVSYPPFAGLNSELSRLAGGKTDLKRAEFTAVEKWWANENVKNLPPLFEEVQSSLNTTYKAIGNEIADQYERQLSLIRQAATNSADMARYLTSSAIHDRMAASCREDMQKDARAAATQSGRGASPPAYELFEVTDIFIRTNAARLEAEYFSGYARSLNTIPVSSRELAGDILSDTAAQKTARQGKELLTAKKSRELNGWAASAYVMRPEADSSVRNNATVKYFASKLAETNALASAWTECVARNIEVPFKTARTEAAGQQMKKHFARLNSAEILPEETLNMLAGKRNFARFKTMAELRESLPELAPAEKDTGVLLEETEDLALQKANELAAAAEEALRGQESCLRQLEKDKIPQLEKDVAARRSVSEICSEWAMELSGRWETRIKNTGSPYHSILGRTTDLLNKTVRQLYDARLPTAEKKSAPQDSSKQAAQVKQEEQSKKPQNASGGGAADEAKTPRKTKGETTADLFIVIRDVDKGKCEALLESADGAMLAKTTFNPDRVEDAAENVISGLRENIEQTLASKQTVTRGALFGLLPARRSGLKELNIYIVAQSSRVRLKTSLLIRDGIESLLDEWSQKSALSSPKLRWGSGFSSDGEKKLEK